MFLIIPSLPNPYTHKRLVYEKYQELYNPLKRLLCFPSFFGMQNAVFYSNMIKFQVSLCQIVNLELMTVVNLTRCLLNVPLAVNEDRKYIRGNSS